LQLEGLSSATKLITSKNSSRLVKQDYKALIKTNSQEVVRL